MENFPSPQMFSSVQFNLAEDILWIVLLFAITIQFALLSKAAYFSLVIAGIAYVATSTRLFYLCFEYSIHFDLDRSRSQPDCCTETVTARC